MSRIVFSTARYVDPAGDHLSINGELELTEGMNSDLLVYDVSDNAYDANGSVATQGERSGLVNSEAVELADVMIRRWAAFRKKHAAAQPTIEIEIQCVASELALRKATYPKWIVSGRMKQEMADREIDAMGFVLERLKGARG